MTVSKTTGRYNITRGVVLAKRNRGFGSSFTIRNVRKLKMFSDCQFGTM